MPPRNSQKNGTNKRGYVKTLWNFFSSIGLTVFLLILLASVSIIGTVIPQNASPDEYLRHYSFSTYHRLHDLGFLDVYHSWWFVLLLALLCVTLAVCSARNFPRIWRILTRDDSILTEGTVKTLSLVERIKTNLSLEEAGKAIIPALRKYFGTPRETIDQEGSHHLFVEKAKYSRMGVFITHVSVILILTGGLIGSLFGFKAHVTIVEGESADQVVLQNSASVKDLGFEVRCDDFEVTYYPNGAPKDYKSTLTILEAGNRILTKTIEVNHPLRYQGILFYQSSYGVTTDRGGDVILAVQQTAGSEPKQAVRVEVGGGFSLPGDRLVTVNRFFSDFILDENGNPLNQSPALRNPAVELLVSEDRKSPRRLWVFQNFPDFPGSSDGTYRFFFEGFQGKEFTGLQVTKDPGVNVVWAGCGLLMMGILFMFLFSHRRVWVRLRNMGDKLEIVIAGTANKNRLAFEKEFGKLKQEIMKLENRNSKSRNERNP